MQENSGKDEWEQAVDWEHVAEQDHDEPARGGWLLGGLDPDRSAGEPVADPPPRAGGSPGTVDPRPAAGGEPGIPSGPASVGWAGTPRRLLRAVPTKALVAAGTLVVVVGAIALAAGGGTADQPDATPRAEGSAPGRSAPPPTGLPDPRSAEPTVPVPPADGEDTAPADGDAPDPEGFRRRGESSPPASAAASTAPRATGQPRADSGQSVGPSPAASRAVEPQPTTAPAYGAPRAGITVRLVNLASGKSAGVSGGSGADGARVVQSSNTGDSAQHWRLIAGQAGCYHLVNARTGKAFDNTDGTSVNGMQMQQWTYYDGSHNQTWCFTALGGNRYSIKNMTSGFLLDVRDGGTADGVAVQQWNADPADPNANQTWRLARVS
ncbi:RICIN domain-containing protein [Micromonospora radicis]|uniref:Ricin B lectin domain-containing protein n=1 Tax=Micromonospora radicis TaxID=1894971 RepID=A0A418MR11_9ACTN|nr:RICIN domain-containing protein [Micromonospora radicis]RIV36062.1 hypothetical protein D2L64_20725 [Micromonospora radicis]